MASAITQEAAAELAAKLELDVDEVGICHACLSFISFPLRDGDGAADPGLRAGDDGSLRDEIPGVDRHEHPLPSLPPRMRGRERGTLVA